MSSALDDLARTRSIFDTWRYSISRVARELCASASNSSASVTYLQPGRLYPMQQVDPTSFIKKASDRESGTAIIKVVERDQGGKPAGQRGMKEQGRL